MARRCYFVPLSGFVEGEGWRAAVVTEGGPGFAWTGVWPYTGRLGETRPYFWGPTLEDAEAAADEQNRRLGLTPNDCAQIIVSSIAAQNRIATLKRFGPEEP